MGSSADMAVHPAFALLIGAIAGTVSVFGFSTLQGLVENHLRIHDTCGVLNLHGIPGIIGGVASIIASAAASGDAYSISQMLFIWSERDTRDAAKQAKLQLAFLIITLGISIITGLFCGILLSRLTYPKKFFLDSTSWETPSREVPYFFDKRGEAKHSSERSDNPAPAGAASQGLVAAEGIQLDELKNKVAYLENMLRSQRKTLRDQGRALEGLGARGSPATPAVGSAVLGSPRGFGSLEPEESQSLLRPSGSSGSVPPFGNRGGDPVANLAAMMENLAAKVNFLVEHQKNK